MAEKISAELLKPDNSIPVVSAEDTPPTSAPTTASTSTPLPAGRHQPLLQQPGVSPLQQLQPGAPPQKFNFEEFSSFLQKKVNSCHTDGIVHPVSSSYVKDSRRCLNLMTSVRLQSDY